MRPGHQQLASPGPLTKGIRFPPPQPRLRAHRASIHPAALWSAELSTCGPGAGLTSASAWKPRTHLLRGSVCADLLSQTQSCKCGNKKAGIKSPKFALVGGTCQRCASGRSGLSAQGHADSPPLPGDQHVGKEAGRNELWTCHALHRLLCSQGGLILEPERWLRQSEGVTHTLFCQKPRKAVGSTPKPLQLPKRPDRDRQAREWSGALFRKGPATKHLPSASARLLVWHRSVRVF